MIPEDVIIGKNVDGKGSLKSLDKVEEDEMILDIGPITTEKINKTIDSSKTVLWNGPAGYFENSNFENCSDPSNMFTTNNKLKSFLLLSNLF